MNSEQIGKILEENCEMIWKIWKKSKSNSDNMENMEEKEFALRNDMENMVER